MGVDLANLEREVQGPGASTPPKANQALTLALKRLMSKDTTGAGVYADSIKDRRILEGDRRVVYEQILSIHAPNLNDDNFIAAFHVLSNYSDTLVESR